jgi:hypothetical protein
MGPSRILPAALLAAAAAGCTSPFSTLGPETGPPEDPEAIGSGIRGWPFLETAWHGETRRTDVLWPLVTVRSAEEGRIPEPDAALPLFVHASSPEGTRWGLRPLFDLESRTTAKGEVSDTDLLFPIFKIRSAPGESRFDVRPLLWTGRKGEDSHAVLFPVFWDFQSPGESSLHLWPLWGREIEGTRRKDWTLAPFFAWERDPEEGSFALDAPWPLAHFGSSPEGTTARLLPLLWHEASADASATVLFPLWWDIEDEEGSFRALFPLWGRQRSGTDGPRPFERSFYGLNAWIATRDGEHSSTDVLWPLLHYGAGPDRWTARIFPVLWLDRKGEGDGHTHLWPLFGSETRGKRREISTCWPLAVYGWSPESSSLQVIGPLVEFTRRGEDRSTSAIFPLFRFERKGERRESHLLWFLWNEESQGPDGPSEGDVALFLARWRSGKESGEFRILGKLFVRTTSPERSVLALNPFFRRETNARGDLHWSVLFGLLAATTREGETDWRVLWFL